MKKIGLFFFVCTMVVPLFRDDLFLYASPGFPMGTTRMDRQHFGTISKQIVKSSSGEVHVIWMDSTLSQVAKYACVPDTGAQIVGGTAAFITLDIFSDGRGVPSFHTKLPQWPGPMDFASAVWIDLFPCVGGFNTTFVDTITLPPVFPLSPNWPHIAIDALDIIHVAAIQSPAAGGDPDSSPG